MKQVLFPIFFAALLSSPALAQEPTPAGATPEAKATADAPKKDDAKPCEGKKDDCPDCPDQAGKGDCGDCGGCCDDDDDDCADCPSHGDAKPCEGRDGAKSDGKPCEGKPCEGKPCDDHGNRGHGFGGLFGGWGSALQPHALIQTQVGLFAGADNQIANGDVVEAAGNFIMRRARLGLSGHISERLTWVLSTDFADVARGASPIHEASMSLHFLKHMDVTAGAHLVPFSHFAMLGSGDQALAQRPKAVDAMAPFRQVGASLHGHYDIGGIQWWVGAYNSFERSPASYYTGIVENSFLFTGANGNRARGYSVAARIQAEPLGSLGTQAAGINNHEKFKFEVGAGGYYNDAGGTASWAMSGDLHLKSHGAHLMVEYLFDSAKPKVAPTVDSLIPDTVKRMALIAELGYTWHRLNAAVRMEYIDPNTDLKDNRDQLIISGAVGCQLTKNRARLQLQYDHRDQLNGPALKDDTLFAQVQVKL
jgi:hypothetical protein